MNSDALPKIGETVNYHVSVAQDNPANMIFKMVANSPGLRSFLPMFTRYDKEVTDRIVRRVRDYDGKEELTCAGDNMMFYISIERVVD